MIITDKIAKHTVSFLKNNMSISEEDLEKIDYGIKIIVSNIFKLIILFSTAYFLHITKYVLIALIAFATIRLFSSGIHANSTMQCIIMNYILFFGNVYLSIYFPMKTISKVIIFIISVILLFLYAPADTKKKPLVSKKLRKSLKIKSIITSTILFIISLIVKSPINSTIIVYSILESALVVTPASYKLLGQSYNNYLNVEL